uniref:NADH-ubiquinone oxidoreductase chain 3 n=1 Tax=Artyfechinostomum sufrartyfex TaxID=408854 RepID=A0A2P0QD36_9TREM|nr:NADH dehydrogenase subunit 3 [Artyfechinostomum sufrartyfex]ARH10832.1 NADH dehydrogenase subunit 3 [Artyfechinostomum sufrartyfex]
MLGVFSLGVLFLLVFLLVVTVHLFVWNLDLNVFQGERAWISSFECGFLAQRLVENYFSYTYFILLVFFVVFDLEVSLLLNLPLQGVMYKNLLYYTFFLVLLAVGFGVEISRGYVRWGY